MALIKCPECRKEVSDTSYKCANCGFTINKPKRGITGIIFKGLFVLFNAIMILSLIMLIFSSTGDPELADGEAIAKGIGTTTLFIIWIFVGLPLGIMSYITRAKIN